MTLNNPTPQEFGRAVAGIGDVNGDEVPDLLVGAPGQKVGGNEAHGQVFVFSGATGGLLHALNTPTPQEFADFGASVAGVGDVNGDNHADLLVGARGQDLRGSRDQGQVFIFSGANGRRLHTFDIPMREIKAEFGWSVAGAGDVNRDGIPDVLVGASEFDVGGRGQAFLFVSGPAMPRWVALNILPKQINRQTQAVLPVAILTTAKFSAAQVDPLSVRLGPGQAQELHRQGHFRDVDGDGDKDLVLHFKTQAIGLGCGE